ncbi:hypothetical protein [Streptomonospora alba]|uniref:hypothetical protein n=1 Tax=Streptomonospora alba TaxID=183763 RepID=UPI00187DAA83|nr:hypothetical protein [Streptomonospora alba]
MDEVYEHVTPAMKGQMRTVLDHHWRQSLQVVKPAEREWLVETVPRLGEYYRAAGAKADWWGSGSEIVSRSSPRAGPGTEKDR